MNTWWYAAIAGNDDGSVTVGKAPMPGPNPGVTTYDNKFIWTLVCPEGNPGLILFWQKGTNKGLVWNGANQALRVNPGNASGWTLASCDNYYQPPQPRGYFGFAIRPQQDSDQNINALGGFDNGHDALVGATIGTWGWDGGAENETWAIMVLDGNFFLPGLDDKGWPAY